MAKHARTRNDEQEKRLERNRQTMLAVISGQHASPTFSTRPSSVRLLLSRFVIDHASGKTLPYEGATGIERLLQAMLATYRDGQIMTDGRLTGVRGTLGIEGHDQQVELSATLGVGGQLVLSVGPSDDICALLAAIRVFDRHVHLAAVSLGRDLDLVAQGYNPTVESPSDIVPVPLPRNVLMNAYLSRTGRFARDAIRCTCGTVVQVAVGPDEDQARERYQLATALAPVLAFLTDDTLSMRGGDPRDATAMTRSLVWDQVDAARSGIVPGTFDAGFGFAAYERWMEGVAPILFASDEGVTFSCGADGCERVLEEREVTEGEASRLLETALPDARWNGTLELRSADSLPPRLAAGYAALAKGIFGSPESLAAARTLLGLADADEQAVRSAWNNLRAFGWQARIYGRPIGQVADELAAIASRSLPLREERQLLDGLAQLWMVRMVPRDALLSKWKATRVPTPEEQAVELYGEGAVIPYDELAGEPPAGSTSVMRLDQLRQA